MADTRNTRFAPSRETLIAAFTLLAILLHLALRYALHCRPLHSNLPLFAALLIGGIPMVWALVKKLWCREFGSDLLAGISIVTAIVLGEYLVAAIVVLMLSGGEALEASPPRVLLRCWTPWLAVCPALPTAKKPAALEDIKLADIKSATNSPSCPTKFALWTAPSSLATA